MNGNNVVEVDTGMLNRLNLSMAGNGSSLSSAVGSERVAVSASVGSVNIHVLSSNNFFRHQEDEGAVNVMLDISAPKPMVCICSAFRTKYFADSPWDAERIVHMHKPPTMMNVE